MKQIEKTKEKVSEFFKDEDLFDFDTADVGELILYLLTWLITPAVFYILGYLLFSSHRVSFFFCAPIGLLVNFFFKKIVNFQVKFLIVLIFISTMIFILYSLGFLGYWTFRWIWNSLPN